MSENNKEQQQNENEGGILDTLASVSAKVIDAVAAGVEKATETGTHAVEAVTEMVGLGGDSEEKESTDKDAEKKELPSDDESQKNNKDNSASQSSQEDKVEVIQLTGLPTNIEQNIRHEG